jgi:hypothetical protein
VSRENLPFCLAHRAFAALMALFLRCSAVSFLARALPPFLANSTAYESFFFATLLILYYSSLARKLRACKHFVRDYACLHAYNLNCLGIKSVI